MGESSAKRSGAATHREPPAPWLLVFGLVAFLAVPGDVVGAIEGSRAERRAGEAGAWARSPRSPETRASRVSTGPQSAWPGVRRATLRAQQRGADVARPRSRLARASRAH